MKPGVTPVVLARAASDAARAIRGVLDLQAGAVGEFATYGGGQRVPGVRVDLGPPVQVTLRLVAAFGRPLDALTVEVRDAVRRTVATLTGQPEPTVDLHVVDVRADAPDPVTSLAAATPTSGPGGAPWHS